MIKKRIEKLRKMMKEKNIDVYYIPTSDFHDSEYISEYFKEREYMSGFTGSAGTLVVSKKEAGLFTDGRYFIQAEKEIKDSEIKLYKMGEPDCPTVSEYLKSIFSDGKCLGFDGAYVSTAFVRELKDTIGNKKIKIKYNVNFVNKIWKDRPEIQFNDIYLLDEKYSGESAKSKLERLRNKMKEKNTDVHILSSLDDIAWLFNIRGNDIENNPVAMSFAIIYSDRALLFCKVKKIPDDVKNYLSEAGVEFEAYENIYEYVKNNINKSEKVLLDTERINYKLYKSINAKEIIEDENPTTLMKAIKNPVEIENTRKAHLKDGVAVTKFMYWLKKNINKPEPLSEYETGKEQDRLRKEQENFIDHSFNTICAYNSNAAMMHYCASEYNFSILSAEGMLLVDSGGHYFEGTTDITRTYALGDLSEEMKMHYTLVLKSMLRLSKTRFLYGCTGQNLDIVARGPLWDIGMDYKCGTGHGVGYLLNVHEGPNSFRWKNLPGKKQCVLEEGMITTDEPGVYIEGQYGIRIENELLCKKSMNNGNGQFMEFEMLTMAPIDLDAVEKKYLDEEDKKSLNIYHQKVFENISPFLTNDEKEWLRNYTKSI